MFFPIYNNGPQIGRVVDQVFTWRKLWLNLAIAEKQLGLFVSEEPRKFVLLSYFDNLLPHVRRLCTISTKTNGQYLLRQALPDRHLPHS